MTRQLTILVSLVSAILVIALMARILPPDAAAIMLDVKRASWPITVQNILWLAFFVGLGELTLRWQAGRQMRDFLTTWPIRLARGHSGLQNRCSPQTTAAVRYK